MSTFVLQGASASLRKIDYLKELNQEQLAVVLGGDGPCLVLAGAGSGKTRALTYRVAYLVEQGVDPSSILLLTFTNKAAREMLARVSSIIGDAARGLWGGTFHSVAARLLRTFASRLGYEPTFSILDQEDARDLLKAVLKDLNMDPKARRFPSPAVVLDVISYSRNTQTSFLETLEWKHPNFFALSGEIEEAARQYQVRKKSANVMDFDDLLSSFALVLDDPDIGRALSDRFRYILVDEYQDINALQARLVYGLGRQHKNMLVVGDDAQSIYAFRGSDVKNILCFPKDWPETRLFPLVTNYRSSAEILDLANESLEHNKERFEKQLIGVHGKKGKPNLVPCMSATQEARYIAEQVLALRSKGVGLHQMAVLFRSSAHSQALEFELMKRDVPYEYRGGQKFFERAHIKDALAFLRVVENPHDEVAWLRVLGLQSGIGATTASALAKGARVVTEFGQVFTTDLSVALSSRAQVGWQDFLSMAERMMGSGRSPSLMIRALLDSKYRDYLEQEYPNWKDRLEDLEQLALFAESYDLLTPFLSDISLYDEIMAAREGALCAAEERLVLSTIHQAKGLEWDTVFVMHMADTAFPNRRALAQEGGMEEERRLFYVAITRARTRLFLTYPLTMGHDTLIFNQPSTFLEEVSPRLFERVEIRERGGVGRRLGSSWNDEDPGFAEPTVEWDALGEKKQISFLREIDEL